MKRSMGILKLFVLLTSIAVASPFHGGETRDEDVGIYNVGLSRIHYQDGAGRVVDYNFSAGSIQQYEGWQDTIKIPGAFITGRASGEEEAVFLWQEPRPDRDTAAGLSTNILWIGIEQAQQEGDEKTGLWALDAVGDTTANAADNWAFETSVGNFSGAELENHTYKLSIGGWNPHAHDGIVLPEVNASWFIGERDGSHNAAVLMVTARINNPATNEDWTSKTVYLQGYDPATATVELRVHVARQSTFTASYRLNGGTWQEFWQHTVDQGQMPGFPQLVPYVSTATEKLASDTSAPVSSVDPTASSTSTVRAQYTLTYTAAENGTIDGNSVQTVEEGTDGQAVTAVPDTGYRFLTWSDGVQTATRTDTNITADLSVTAEFAAKSVPTIDWSDPAPIVYGTQLGDAQLNATTEDTPGTFVYDPPAGTLLNAGQHILSVAFTPDDQENWTSANATATLQVTKAPQVIVFTNPGRQTETDTVALEASGGDSGNPVTFAVTAGPAIIDGNNILSFTGTGDVTITASQAGDENYEAAPDVARTFSVSVSTLWALAMTIDGAEPSPLFIGMAEAATDGFDPGVDVEAPPSTAGGNAWLSNIDFDVDYQEDYRNVADEAEYLLVVQAGTDRDVAVFWNAPELPTGKHLSLWEVDIDQAGGVIEWLPLGGTAIDMSSDTELVVGADETRIFMIRYAADLTFDWRFETGWNLKSLPLTPHDPNVTAVFAGHNALLAGNVWQWLGQHYVIANSLEAFRGYWIYAESPQIVMVRGLPEPQGSLELQSGWNLIGVGRAGWPAEDPSVVSASFNRDSRGQRYRAVTELDAGRGYWIYAEEAASVPMIPRIDNLYLVIDLSAGPTAASYPVSYRASVPPGGWTDEHKTTKMVMRRINAGTFTMGSPVGELGREPDETQREVTLTEDFYIGVFPVTQKQWERVVEERPWPSFFSNPAYRDTRPVERVSWNDVRGGDWPNNGQPAAAGFIQTLRERTGLNRADLPTEAQWEYAGRAGTTTALNSGKNLTNKNDDPNMDEVGRYWYNGGSEYTKDSDTSAGSAAVGSYQPNNWGLYDMHGNVWEWCLDWYEEYHAPTVNPVGPASGIERIWRGGSWQWPAHYCRSARRSRGFEPTGQFANVGFRLARSTP